MRDSHHYVVDDQSQLPPHLLPPPYLVDIDGHAYPIHQQEAILRLVRPAQQRSSAHHKEEMEDYDEYMKTRLARVNQQSFGFRRARRQVGGAPGSGRGSMERVFGGGEGVSDGRDRVLGGEGVSGGRGSMERVFGEGRSGGRGSMESSSDGGVSNGHGSMEIKNVLGGEGVSSGSGQNGDANTVMVTESGGCGRAEKIAESANLSSAHPSHTSNCNDVSTDPIPSLNAGHVSLTSVPVPTLSSSIHHDSPTTVPNPSLGSSSTFVSTSIPIPNLGSSSTNHVSVLNSKGIDMLIPIPNGQGGVLATVLGKGRSGMGVATVLGKGTGVGVDVPKGDDRRSQSSSVEGRGERGSVNGDREVERSGEREEGEVKSEVERRGGGEMREGDGEVEMRGGDGEVEMREGDCEVERNEGDGEVEMREGDGEVEGNEGDGEVERNDGDDEVERREGNGEVERREGDGEVKRRERDVVDVQEDSQDGQNVQNMMSSLVYSLGLNELETKQIISLWHNRTIIPPLDPAHLSHELKKRTQFFAEEHRHYELQSRRALLRDRQVRSYLRHT